MADLLVPQGDPVLHRVANEVPEEMFGTKELAGMLEKMRDGLHAYDVAGYTGVAIAAPQVGIPYRMFLVEDMSPNRTDEEKLPTLVAINPKLTKRSRQKSTLGEGCLSVPDHYGAVRRADNVTLKAKDEKGRAFTRGAGGFLAQVFQHETDHLDGVLFVDIAEKVWRKDELKDEGQFAL